MPSLDTCCPYVYHPPRGGEHQRKELSGGRIRRGNSLPEGEIDAIAIVIERDIISIIIIIISTIYTAITTAAPRISMNEVRKKLFTISLSGKAAHWYKLLKNGDSIDWEDIVPLFYSKFYPPSEIHKDRNRIYNFWPHDGESIAQAWGRLKSLMLKCPIHELPGNVIIDNFYARLSFQDKTLLDTSCSGSFTRKNEEFKRDLLDRIQENTEGWENGKDRESGIIYDYKCIEAFMDTDKFRNMSATYGLDSQVVANLYRAFASHYELPKKNFDKYDEPYKDKIDSSVNKCVVIETVDNVIPEAYIEKTPFPAKMKEYSVISSAVNKSEKKPKEPEEQIKIELAVAIVKDLVTENVEDGHIIFCEDASNIVSHPNKSKQVSVPMLSVRIGDHCYYGLCDIGASVSAIPYELYTEIMHEIGSCELEDIDVVIHLANRETISPIGIVRDVEVLCGKIKYPADFLVLGSAASDHCPIIFGRPFLNTCGAIIDCKKEKILTRFAGEPYEFNFSKFTKTPYKTDLPSNDFKMEQCASIVLVPNNPLQQHLENSESEAFRKERDELEEIFRRQPILKHDLPVEDLGTTPPPKEDPVFDLKPLPDNLKYAHIDDKKIYPVIISSKLSEIEEERLLEILKKHRGAIGYTLDDLKGISPSICQHAINMEEDAKPVVEHQRRLIPKMKEVVRNEVLKLLEAGALPSAAAASAAAAMPRRGSSYRYGGVSSSGYSSVRARPKLSCDSPRPLEPNHKSELSLNQRGMCLMRSVEHLAGTGSTTPPLSRPTSPSPVLSPAIPPHLIGVTGATPAPLLVPLFLATLAAHARHSAVTVPGRRSPLPSGQGKQWRSPPSYLSATSRTTSPPVASFWASICELASSERGVGQHLHLPLHISAPHLCLHRRHAPPRTARGGRHRHACPRHPPSSTSTTRSSSGATRASRGTPDHRLCTFRAFSAIHELTGPSGNHRRRSSVRCMPVVVIGNPGRAIGH
ncbi:hypothetical protein QYE76_069596 [Lolium multiflorum]|uniref:Retrotransposon gag domain-containing protein n=1 Tax=Lolium multiflorum TaxID=4521 RepID=A0AAD8SI21_LOLMU|nr:hypothetical protein QYE76_069596 [Lolium multiflorum]